MKGQRPKTSGTMNFLIIRPIDHEEENSVENNSFPVFIWMFLYLMKYSRPIIANETQKTSKVMDGLNQDAFLVMQCLIPGVLD